MAWRGSPRGLRAEFDEMLGEMQKQFSDVIGRISGGAPQGSPLGGAGTMVDVVEREDEIMVVADLPGVDREEISVRLLDARTIRVTARREEEKEEHEVGYHMRERRYGAISRTVTLPTDVLEEGATATFKNGVLEVRLKKVAEERGREIRIGAEAGKAAAEMRRETIEGEYREDREKVKSSGYLSPREIQEAARKVRIEDRGSPEEQEMAAKLREQKERLYEEGKKRLAE
ncbi:Hsp20/alpha crystallin family protein [Methanoculleus sp. Afa-1]|uniref:Hsp20/alpha crystallin family protein n=1 Tax=Methanoculleus formosensis TaxID=2590886 RepID=A0A9E4ZJD5_9EURY|nr:Hsp20/alpha crystallin family protein [Methanoculleus sp. Afa-1]MCT8336648.1 Hsp20/alpha crystallin family protein [Methanoculleus sp. Afa-1]